MLNQETKRRIDSARDILVGKVPDPKAQVEQITTAMIYKFMDDMDKEAQELGGKARFFTNGYEKYSWTIIMDPKLGGHERLNLYAEAVIKMAENPHIPQLFRDIFKDAFLPYRSPETLSLFLKEINGFKYIHSEDLGDAFEYLLSILGSQGDAGQFRTPRHIIDFIVDVVDPKKEETILDPACGTAGFLISAYKHILASSVIPAKAGIQSSLSPEDKKRMMNHIVGYDISPDMVKLSKVNMYLHGFPTPHIFEYDTLSSEEKWDETYDVIMANPPFMTPKGGIRPHKRFSVQANRAEVLFVNYIMEHLNINGRAGIIVPEGIIFQSGNAYKQLRKLLVDENYLWAVVSLPAGVFQPYSGVKTSILFLDRQIAKQSDSILFIKVDNDGYDLGAQRREINKNDLPLALTLIESYKRNIVAQNTPKTDELETLTKNTISIFVPKSKIRELGDYYLTGDRYKEINQYKNQKWPMVELSSLIEEINEKSNNNIEVWSVTNNEGFINTESYFDKKISSDNTSKYKIIRQGFFAYNPSRINVGSIAFNNFKQLGCVSPMYVVFKIKDEKLLDKYLFLLLKGKILLKEIKLKSFGAVRQQLRFKDLQSIKIPLPPLQIQKKVVEEIDGYQNRIDAAERMINNWFPYPQINPSWPLKKIGDIADINPSKPNFKEWHLEKDVSFLPMSALDLHAPNPLTMEKRKLKEVMKGYTYFQNDDILLAKITPCFENGKSGVVKNLINEVGFGSTEFIVLRVKKDSVLPLWIWLFIYQKEFIEKGKSQMTGSAGQKRLPISYVVNYEIPVPDLSTQQAQISKLQLDFNLIKQIKNQVIPEFEEKINDLKNKIFL